jgi:hypothetical protein
LEGGPHGFRTKGSHIWGEECAETVRDAAHGFWRPRRCCAAELGGGCVLCPSLTRWWPGVLVTVGDCRWLLTLPPLLSIGLQSRTLSRRRVRRLLLKRCVTNNYHGISDSGSATFYLVRQRLVRAGCGEFCWWRVVVGCFWWRAACRLIVVGGSFDHNVAGCVEPLLG